MAPARQDQLARREKFGVRHVRGYSLYSLEKNVSQARQVCMVCCTFVVPLQPKLIGERLLANSSSKLAPLTTRCIENTDAKELCSQTTRHFVASA